MSTEDRISSLIDLEYIPYLDEKGCIPGQLQNLIGVYAIFDRDRVLAFVGYSRDIYSSLKEHLIRQPESCYWVKFQAISRPDRARLEEIRRVWIENNGTNPPGNGEREAGWTQPIDAKNAMSEAEKEQYRQSDESGKIELLKKVARRVETQIEERLKHRGARMEIRFNPKLKERGTLALK